MKPSSVGVTNTKRLLCRACERYYGLDIVAGHREKSLPGILSNVLEWLSWGIAAEAEELCLCHPVGKRPSRQPDVLLESLRTIGQAGASRREQQ